MKVLFSVSELYKDNTHVKPLANASLYNNISTQDNLWIYKDHLIDSAKIIRSFCDKIIMAYNFIAIYN